MRVGDLSPKIFENLSHDSKTDSLTDDFVGNTVFKMAITTRIVSLRPR